MKKYLFFADKVIFSLFHQLNVLNYLFVWVPCPLGLLCRITSDPENYRHANLPYGKDLTDQTLKGKMKTLLSTLITNPRKLMTTGITTDRILE